MPDQENLYEVLQVHHSAEPEVIEAAYRRLLRMYELVSNDASIDVKRLFQVFGRASG